MHSHQRMPMVRYNSVESKPVFGSKEASFYIHSLPFMKELGKTIKVVKVGSIEQSNRGSHLAPRASDYFVIIEPFSSIGYVLKTSLALESGYGERGWFGGKQ
ncbi:MAG: hypothetical protein GKR96_03610 [Gammaproteobacteria bacterium]|nr:hypothetical protein [Gammaproteobacteria bacterium]